MKILLLMTALASALLWGPAQAEPSLTADQVSKLGRVVLSAEENKEFKEVFWKDQPTFDKETQVWTYRNGWPRTPDDKAYIFEIRETDGHYRLGWRTPWKASAPVERFRIQPSIRRKLLELFREFAGTNIPG